MKSSTAKRRYNFLLVDDDEVFCQTFLQLLEEEGAPIQCETCSAPFIALNKAKHEDFDAVVTDIGMPGMTGIELIHKIHAYKPDLPTILITGHPDFTSIDAVDAGASDFIRKPFAMDEFCARFKRIMRDHQLLLQIQDTVRRVEKVDPNQQEAAAEQQLLIKEIEWLQGMLSPER
jgi:DNA-binding NtrC family response regulator